MALNKFVPLYIFTALLNIYNALILPLFDYCDVVWGNLNKGLADRMGHIHDGCWTPALSLLDLLNNSSELR